MARQIAIWAVVLSVALMPGTLRAVTVHVHDQYGAHDHQHPLFAAPAASHHHRHDADEPAEKSTDSGETTALSVEVVDEATNRQNQAQALMCLPVAAPLPVILDVAPPRDISPPICCTSWSAPPRTPLCRLLQTSHALLF